MARVKSKNSNAETALRSALHRSGLRFRLHRRVEGVNVDIVFVTAQVAVFVDGCFPYGGLKRSVQTAAGRFLKDGNSLNGMIVAGSLFVLPTDESSGLVEIKHAPSDPYMRSDQGRNPMSGGAIVIHRGAFSKWSMEFMVRYNESVLSIEQVVTLFMWAGFAVGLGEWRPEKGGTYGQFEVVTK